MGSEMCIRDRFRAVGLYDEGTVTKSATWSVQTTGPYADLVPDTADNLALKAARLLDRRLRYRQGPVHIRIDKAIPVAGGMAGGSADAAAALVACDALWGMRAEREHLDIIGAAIGSDVPFALHGGIAYGLGLLLFFKAGIILDAWRRKKRWTGRRVGFVGVLILPGLTLLSGLLWTFPGPPYPGVFSRVSLPHNTPLPAPHNERPRPGRPPPPPTGTPPGRKRWVPAIVSGRSGQLRSSVPVATGNRSAAAAS